MVRHRTQTKEEHPITKSPTRSKDGSAPKKDLAKTVVTSLDDDKAEDIVTIDLRGRSSVADQMVIATGRSGRQVGAMADHLLEEFKNAGVKATAEGMGQGDWVLIDAGDIVVHLFRPEVREFYDLEGMWNEEADEEDDKKPAKAKTKRA
jgi:ribosome-associated protein